MIAFLINTRLGWRRICSLSIEESMVFTWIRVIDSVKTPRWDHLEGNDTNTIAWYKHMQCSNEIELAQLSALFRFSLLSYRFYVIWHVFIVNSILVILYFRLWVLMIFIILREHWAFVFEGCRSMLWLFGRFLLNGICHHVPLCCNCVVPGQWVLSTVWVLECRSGAIEITLQLWSWHPWCLTDVKMLVWTALLRCENPILVKWDGLS